jgi:hypothetical protein
MVESARKTESGSTGEGGSKGFIKWVGGIVAAVVVPVAIYYATRQPPPPPPPIAQTEFDGFVQDAASHSLITGAKMTLTLGSASIVQTTDGSGKYSVVLPSPNADASMGAVEIAATGYQPYSNSVELKPGENYAVIPVDAIPPVAVPVPAAGGVIAPAPPPPVQAHVETHPKIFVTKLPPNFVRAQTKYMGLHP